MVSGPTICGKCGGDIVVIGGDLYKCTACGLEIDLAEDEDFEDLD